MLNTRTTSQTSFRAAVQRSEFNYCRGSAPAEARTHGANGANTQRTGSCGLITDGSRRCCGCVRWWLRDFVTTWNRADLSDSLSRSQPDWTAS